MRIQLLLFAVACFLISAVLPGCHTSHQYTTTHKTSKQPKFIEDIYLNGHNKSSVTENGIDPSKPKPKATAKPKLTLPIPDEEHPEAVPMETCAIEPPKKEHYSEKELSGLKDKYAEILGLRPKEIKNYSLYQFID